MIGSEHHPVIHKTELEVMADAGGHPQLITDVGQKVLDANDRFLLISGFSLHELDAVRLEDLLQQEDRERFAEHWKVLTESGKSIVTARLRTKGEFTVQARFQSELADRGEIRTVMLGMGGEHFPGIELKYRNRYTLALYEIGRQMTSSFDVDEVLRLVVKNIAWLLESHFVAVATLDAKTSLVTYREIVGNKSDYFASDQNENSRGIPGRVIASQQPFIIDKFPDKPPVDPTEFKVMVAENLVSAFGVPITNKGRWFGAIVVGYRRYHEITEEEIQLAANLANQTALALENAMLYQESVKYSKTMATLTSRLALIQEEERRRITRDLHDGIGQALIGLRFNLDLLVRQASITGTEAIERVLMMKQVIDETLITIRQIAFDLRPPILDDLGIVSALRIYVDRFQERTKILLVLSCPDDLKRFDPKAESTVYRVIQEALTNIAKHSGAKNARIVIEKPDGALFLTISDDGRGFDNSRDIDRGLWAGGLGIDNMKHRIEALNGRFKLTSEKGKGTSINIEIPLNGR